MSYGEPPWWIEEAAEEIERLRADLAEAEELLRYAREEIDDEFVLADEIDAWLAQRGEP